MGGFEAGILVSAEPTVKYHPDESGNLTSTQILGEGHCLAGSLTGAVASQIVTEAREGPLRLNGNQPASVNA